MYIIQKNKAFMGISAFLILVIIGVSTILPAAQTLRLGIPTQTNPNTISIYKSGNDNYVNEAENTFLTSLKNKNTAITNVALINDLKNELGTIIIIGHGNTDGFLLNGQLKSWNSVSSLLVSFKAKTIIFLACYSNSISKVFENSGRIYVGFSNEIDAQIAGFIAAGMINYSSGTQTSFWFDVISIVNRINSISTHNSQPHYLSCGRYDSESGCSWAIKSQNLVSCWGLCDEIILWANFAPWIVNDIEQLLFADLTGLATAAGASVIAAIGTKTVLGIAVTAAIWSGILFAISISAYFVISYNAAHRSLGDAVIGWGSEVTPIPAFWLKAQNNANGDTGWTNVPFPINFVLGATAGGLIGEIAGIFVPYIIAAIVSLLPSNWLPVII